MMSIEILGPLIRLVGNVVGAKLLIWLGKLKVLNLFVFELEN